MQSVSFKIKQTEKK